LAALAGFRRSGNADFVFGIIICHRFVLIIA